MKKKIIQITTLVAFTFLGLPVFAQQTAVKPATPTASQNVTAPLKVEIAEAPKPIVPGGAQNPDTYKPVIRNENQYPDKVIQPVVNDPVVRPATTAPDTKAVQQKPKPAVQPVKEQ